LELCWVNKMSTVRWGILSTGLIADSFTTVLKVTPNAQVVAVGSRTIESATKFADKHGIPKRHASYLALAQDPEVDVIYIATPHNLHKENALLCLQHNKHILVEKPFTMNIKEAKEVFDFAKEKKLFVMEAMWTRFFPVSTYVRNAIKDGVIGDVKFLKAELTFNASLAHKDDPQWRLYNPDLAGGALLDVGVYVTAYSYMVFGRPPTTIHSHMTKASTGVDEQVDLMFVYPSGATALLVGSFIATGPQYGTIAGSKGYIRIPRFYSPERLYIKLADEAEEREIVFPFPEVPGLHKRHEAGFRYEAEEVHKCLWEKKLESSIMPWSETINILETMDTIRKQNDLKYTADA